MTSLYDTAAWIVRAETAEAQLAEAKETIESLSNALKTSEVLRRHAVATLTAQRDRLMETGKPALTLLSIMLASPFWRDAIASNRVEIQDAYDALRTEHDAIGEG